MAGTFSWRPDWGINTNFEFKVNKAEFTDYVQRAAKGINHVVPSVTLNFLRRPVSEVDAMLDFLTSKKGVESFTWYNRREQAGLYTCEEITVSDDDDGVASMTAVFLRVYGG